MDKKIAELIASQSEELKAKPFAWKFKHCTQTHIIEYRHFGTLVKAIVKASIAEPETMLNTDFENMDQIGFGHDMKFY